MTIAIDRPGSITNGNAAAPRFAQDRQTRTWVLNEGALSAVPSRSAVLRYAQRELAGLLRLPKGWDGGAGESLRPELANVGLTFVAALTSEDGLAVPQFSPFDDGGLHITWLVGGDRLTAIFESDSVDIRGVWREGHEAFRFDRRQGHFTQSELEAALSESRCFLVKISEKVRHQILSS